MALKQAGCDWKGPYHKGAKRAASLKERDYFGDQGIDGRMT